MAPKHHARGASASCSSHGCSSRDVEVEVLMFPVLLSAGEGAVVLQGAQPLLLWERVFAAKILFYTSVVALLAVSFFLTCSPDSFLNLVWMACTWILKAILTVLCGFQFGLKTRLWFPLVCMAGIFSSVQSLQG